MGDCLSVVNAARVSFGKQRVALTDADVNLLGYLAKNGHWSPFAHTSLSIRITAPIFVARQLAKHQVGLSWNEVSRRYVDDAPEFHQPKIWRHRPLDNIKQGSGETLNSPLSSLADRAYESAITATQYAYTTLLHLGVAPEQARAVLPLATLTTWIWTGSLYAFARVCKLRLDSHAQAETREIATEIDAIARQYFPHAWGALWNTTD
jgi:thymidylate synthase (FAD)